MTLFHALGPFGAQGGVVGAPGMVLMKPTSITHSGTSATLGANGQVTFTAVTSVSLNGCFTADFDNFVVVSYCVTASGNNKLDCHLRVSGVDATGSNYTEQQLLANGSSVSAFRATRTFARLGGAKDNLRNGAWASVYGPALAQPTAFRTFGVDTLSNATIDDNACTHSLSTAYDGITIFPNSSNMTGSVAVYGVRS